MDNEELGRIRAALVPAASRGEYIPWVLHGREVECARLAALIDNAARGVAGSLVLLGEPGVGKSALLSWAAAHAAGAPLLRVQGVESESPLAFAALHRLLGPLLLRIERLPDPQATALRVALGRESGNADPLLVALATLSMIADAADDKPVLCVLDDAHWLDPASADALLFAARRLHAERVAMLFAARDTEDLAFRPEGLEVRKLAGLDAESVRALLSERAAIDVPAEVSDQLFARTDGNPLALVELPLGLRPAQLAGVEPLPGQLLLPSGVERVFVERTRRLSVAAQTMMLVAVADNTGRLAIVERAAAGLGAGPAAVAEAQRSGLLLISEGGISVRHPLVRSAVYQAATVPERRVAHRALAVALDEVHESERATWQRAAAADGPAEDLAAALAEGGRLAESRGGYRAAADAFERAAELSAGVNPGRLFAGARNAWASGQAARASALLSRARERAADPLLLADIDRLRGRIAVNTGSASDAHRIFIQAAERVSGHDQIRALELAVAATVAQLHGVDSGARLPADAVVVDVTGDDPPRVRCLRLLLLSARSDAAGDPGVALRQLHRALDLVDGDPDSRADLDLLGNLGNAALHLGDDVAYDRLYGRMLSAARENGDAMAVLYALQRTPFGLFVTGRWSALRGSSEEAVALAQSLGRGDSAAASQAWLALLAALQGHPDFDQRLAAVQDLLSAQRPLGILAQPVADLIRWARGVRALHGGDAADALHQFRQIRLQVLGLLAAQDRIDAAVRGGDSRQARIWLADLEAFAAGTRLAWAQGAAAFGRAVTSDSSRTDADRIAGQFGASLDYHLSANRPYDRARAHQAFGEFLRRAGRRVEARGQLRAAIELFDDLRAEPLADRARQELRASGETARRRTPGTVLNLTPMELRVAGLVSQGMSNKDVAAQCWVSPRTVAFHLRNVFTKTGITSRGELARLTLA